MLMVKRSIGGLSLCLAIMLTCGWISDDGVTQAATDNRAAQPPQTISIGGEPVVVLQRPKSSDNSKPQFLEAMIMPGRGMAVLQIKAYIPGKGEIELAELARLTQSGAVAGHGR